MISKEQYEAARLQIRASEAICNAYHKEQSEMFAARWEKFKRGELTFTDDELVYSARARCRECGAGLAYPKDCTAWHRWDCSDSLKNGLNGHEAFPFNFHDIKSEGQPSAQGATTRPSLTAPTAADSPSAADSSRGQR